MEEPKKFVGVGKNAMCHPTVWLLWNCFDYLDFIFVAWCYASAAYAIMRCLSRLWILSKWINISSNFFHYLVSHHSSFSVSKVTVIFWWEPPNRWGGQKSRFWANVWLYHVLSMLRPARCCQFGATGPWQIATLIAGSKRRTLLMAGDDDKMFITTIKSQCYAKDNRTAFNCTQW